MNSTPANRLQQRVNKLRAKPYAHGSVLLLMVLIALFWANSPFYESYLHVFHSDFTIGFEGFALTESLHVWINDGLMALFFFLVGLEIKKEIIDGELSSFKKASLPVIAAIGGMIVPVLFFLIFNYGTLAQKAWGIPMATDIAFALGLISLVGKAVSNKLQVFLIALATADDLGAILVITLFLTPYVDIQSLVAGGVYLCIMALANYWGVRNTWFYLIVGVLGLWIAIFLSGIHATLAGVLGAFTIPARREITETAYQKKLLPLVAEFSSTCNNPTGLLTHHQEEIISEIVAESKKAGTPLQRMEHSIKPFVNYFILPLFALANAGVRIEGDFFQMLFHPLSLGIFGGLVLGKVLGISLFSYFAIKTNIGKLPDGSTWNSIFGIGVFAGIGFTMSLFIAELALEDAQLLSIAKVGILAASITSATLGLIWFYFLFSLKTKP